MSCTLKVVLNEENEDLRATRIGFLKRGKQPWDAQQQQRGLTADEITAVGRAVVIQHLLSYASDAHLPMSCAAGGSAAVSGETYTGESLEDILNG